MRQKNILIIGGGYAGILSAIRLDKRLKNTAQITLITKDETFHERVRFHQVASGQTIKTYPITNLLKNTNVAIKIDSVRKINPDTQTVTTSEEEIQYDYLVYALGSTINRTQVIGINENALTLNYSDLKKLQTQLPHIIKKQGKICVIGGGITGIEMATELATDHPSLQVELITSGRVGQSLSEKAQDYLGSTFTDMKINLLENIRVQEIKNHHLLTTEGKEIPFDLCIWAGGFTTSPVAKEAGIAVNQDGQILIADTLESISHPNIIAVGDAGIFNSEQAPQIRMACATAMPMGLHGAENLARKLKGQPQTPFRFGYVIQCISLGRRIGLVQRVKQDDSPIEKIITGRIASWIKESIVRFTIFSFWVERRFPGTYKWAQPEISTVNYQDVKS